MIQVDFWYSFTLNVIHVCDYYFVEINVIIISQWFIPGEEIINLKYKCEKHLLTGIINWPKIYFGFKKSEYEIKFDSDFKKIIGGSIYHYDEIGDFIDCYPLCDPDLPNQNFQLVKSHENLVSHVMKGSY